MRKREKLRFCTNTSPKTCKNASFLVGTRGTRTDLIFLQNVIQTSPTPPPYIFLCSKNVIKFSEHIEKVALKGVLPAFSLPFHAFLYLISFFPAIFQKFKPHPFHPFHLASVKINQYICQQTHAVPLFLLYNSGSNNIFPFLLPFLCTPFPQIYIYQPLQYFLNKFYI